MGSAPLAGRASRGLLQSYQGVNKRDQAVIEAPTPESAVTDHRFWSVDSGHAHRRVNFGYDDCGTRCSIGRSGDLSPHSQGQQAIRGWSCLFRAASQRSEDRIVNSPSVGLRGQR